MRFCNWPRPVGNGGSSQKNIRIAQTVFYYFSSWKRMVLSKRVRKESGKNERRTAMKIDSQSFGSTLIGTGGHTGHDAGKKTQESKRHIAVDTFESLMYVYVRSAAVQDRNGAETVIVPLETKADRCDSCNMRLSTQVDRFDTKTCHLRLKWTVSTPETCYFRLKWTVSTSETCHLRQKWTVSTLETCHLRIKRTDAALANCQLRRKRTDA